MTAMEKLERKFGKRKGPNLMMGLIIAYAVGYLVTRIAPAAFEALCFNPYEIFRGQVWRLVTFLVATGNGSFFLTLLMCFVYFSIGRALEALGPDLHPSAHKSADPGTDLPRLPDPGRVKVS